ncbi:site-2 protease family protein [Rubripirellula amarantea]|nr:site-2 protease family protein [Rubripirellula amarantea]MDA8744035.1 site-2 protease family protein [Rubripirellula amarantea]
MSLPLAATEELGFLSGLLSNILLWGKVALGIGMVIFVHELGHFVAAKSFGVKCEKFYVGFDVPIKIGPIKFPRTLGKFQWGETEYGIGVIPLGGYVKMLGQDDDPRKLEEENERIKLEGDVDEEPTLDPRSFPAKPVWQRMIIISAGVVVNVITGVLFAAIAYGYGVSYIPAVVGGVSPGGPAWQAGMEPGGKVIAVGDYKDENMPFREMRVEIVTEGMDNGSQPIPISLQYDDGVREFTPNPASSTHEKDLRMIGVLMPNSTSLAKNDFANPQSVAAEVLSEADAGATLVSFDGVAIDETRTVPSTEFFDYLYTHPQKPIELTLKRADGETTTVTLPPQMTKSLGVRYAAGQISALINGGPAEKAGMKVGDTITAVDGDTNFDAFALAVDLVDSDKARTFTVQRGSADSEPVDITIEPKKVLQTVAPVVGISSNVAINAYGFAYEPIPVIASLKDPSLGQGDEPLAVGDRIKEVRLVMPVDKTPEYLADSRYDLLLKELRDGWEFGESWPLTEFTESMQIFPLGTQFEIKAVRPPEDRVITKLVTLTQDDLPSFDRGMNFPAPESIRKAASFGEALTLGLAEGKRRFNDVTRFLKMLPKGKVKLRHVGGPLAIVDIAKNEAEKGISRQLMFLTMLSMNLAILNFLPIPALDGGHMVFLAYELIRGKRANEQLEFRLTVAGLLSLLALMVVVFANDILRYF